MTIYIAPIHWGSDFIQWGIGWYRMFYTSIDSQVRGILYVVTPGAGRRLAQYTDICDL